MPQDNKRTIKIESILGGHAPTTHFAAPDQFYSSLGIDPSLPYSDSFIPDSSGSASAFKSSGLLRPVSAINFGSTAIFSSVPKWILEQPKTTVAYVYDANGSTYSFTGPGGTVTALSDAGNMSGSSGNGAAYYDNYVYFAKNTTIARYGPLDGTAAFNGDYWVTTLSKTALVNTAYPINFLNAVTYPNHVLHRHSDGRLYIADVVGNQGTIHYIQTTKGTVEGDTDNGSTSNKVQVGYGLWPTAMESYGNDLVIAFYEGNVNGSPERAKLAFWDTTSTNINKITWVEFPDSLISALKNVDGVLYVVSGTRGAGGFRISRFVGGYTFEDIYFSEGGEAPMPGAIDGDGKRVIFGSYTNSPEFGGSVYAYGLQNQALGQRLFSIMRATNTAANITALHLFNDIPNTPNSLGGRQIVIGWTTSTNGALDYNNFSTYDKAPSIWWSQIYKIGQPFKITKIRINLSTAVSASTIITPKIYVDDNIPNTTPTTLTAINNTNYSGKQAIVFRPENLTGNYNFWLELRWTGTGLAVVSLPITIEYELLDD